MAITGLTPTNYCFHPLNHSTKFTTTVKTFHHIILSKPCFIILHSSACSTPVLDEEHSPVVPIVELNYGFKTRDSDDTNVDEVLKDLLKDPRTQHLGFEYYEKAKAKAKAKASTSSGFRPKKTVFRSLLSYLVKSKKWDFVVVVCRDMVVYRRVLPDRGFCASLVRDCIKEHEFKTADMLLKCFEFDRSVYVFACVSALRSYNKLHMYRVSIDLYERIKSSEVSLDCRGYVSVMEAYLKLGNYEKVVELFNELESSEKIENVGINIGVVVQVYGVLIEALGKLGQGFKALEQYERMREKGIPSSASIYASLISTLAKMREINIVEKLINEAESEEMIRDPALFLKLVIMYVDEGLMERTLDVVNTMKGVNLKVSDCIFCAIINGFAKKRGIKAAARVYQELISQGCEPGQVTYASIINVFFRLGMFAKARRVFEEMQLRGFDKCVVAYSTMILMYGKTGQLREAMKLLGKMKERGCEPNVWVYNALIDAHGRANNIRQVDKLWKEMKRRKLKPDRVSYTSIISAYSRAKEYEVCTEFHEEYRRNGGKIDLAMAGIMVSIYSKTNRIDELVKILKNLKEEGTKVDARLYRSALNAMRDAGLQLQIRWLQENFGSCLTESLVVK